MVREVRLPLLFPLTGIPLLLDRDSSLTVCVLTSSARRSKQDVFAPAQVGTLLVLNHVVPFRSTCLPPSTSSTRIQRFLLFYDRPVPLPSLTVSHGWSVDGFNTYNRLVSTCIAQPLESVAFPYAYYTKS